MERTANIEGKSLTPEVRAFLFELFHVDVGGSAEQFALTLKSRSSTASSSATDAMRAKSATVDRVGSNPAGVSDYELEPLADEAVKQTRSDLR